MIVLAVGARILAGAVLAATASVPAASTAASAGAGTEGCVTRAEYRAAQHGMTKRRVHAIFGTRGTQVYLVLGNEERRRYRMCDPSLKLTVVYLHGRLGYKQLRDA